MNLNPLSLFLLTIHYQVVRRNLQINSKLYFLKVPLFNSNKLALIFVKFFAFTFKSLYFKKVLTPLICLSIVLIVKQVSNDLFQGKTYNMPIPLPFNLPTINSYFSFSGLPFKLKTCQQWYLYDFDENSSQETIDFIGMNPGEYRENHGLLGNVMNNYTCYYKPNKTRAITRKVVPYFQRPPNVFCIII